MTLQSLRDRIVTTLLTIASATLMAGGATVISTKSDLARVTDRVTRLEELNGNVKALQGELQKTREEMIRSERAR